MSTEQSHTDSPVPAARLLTQLSSCSVHLCTNENGGVQWKGIVSIVVMVRCGEVFATTAIMTSSELIQQWAVSLPIGMD